MLSITVGQRRVGRKPNECGKLRNKKIMIESEMCREGSKLETNTCIYMCAFCSFVQSNIDVQVIHIWDGCLNKKQRDFLSG